VDDHFHGAPVVGLTLKIVFHGDAVKLVVFVGADHFFSFSLKKRYSLPSKLYTFTGKRDKNSFAFPLTAGENINTFNHQAMMALYYSTPSELETLNQLANADDVVVFMEGNDSKIYVLGLDKGLNATAGEGGSGILLNDSTAYMITLSGEQTTAPNIFRVNAAASLATNQAYLDALT
jgi:hypothetical protein